MDFLEEFFIRRKLLDDAIEITSITTRRFQGSKDQRSTQDYLDQRGSDAISIKVEETNALEDLLAALQRLYKTRKPVRRVLSRGKTTIQSQAHHQVTPARHTANQWIEWLILVAIGLVGLSMPAFGTQAQCESDLPHNFVQISVEWIASSFKR